MAGVQEDLKDRLRLAREWLTTCLYVGPVGGSLLIDWTGELERRLLRVFLRETRRLDLPQLAMAARTGIVRGRAWLGPAAVQAMFLARALKETPKP